MDQSPPESYKARLEHELKRMREENASLRKELASVAADRKTRMELGLVGTHDLIYPHGMTQALRQVLKLNIFEIRPVVTLFLAVGSVPRASMEEEQAFVMHWLIGLALMHGPKWRAFANAKLDELRLKVPGPDISKIPQRKVLRDDAR